MRRQWLARADSPRLILLFGGWALGAAPFRGLTGAENLLLVDDYRQLDDPLPELAGFERVDLVAFSFGVAAAGHWLAAGGQRPDRLVAISGTLAPADAGHGIAPDTIRATADQLSSDSFARFCRRAGLTGALPEIDRDAAQAELLAVIARGPAPATTFDRIWIPDRDRIIPTQAQHAAWDGQRGAVRQVPGPHVPFQPGQSWTEWLA